MTFKSDELIKDLSLNNFEDIIQKYDNKNKNFYYSDFDIQKYSTHDIYKELEKINNKNAESIYKDIMTIVDKKRQENETM